MLTMAVLGVMSVAIYKLAKTLVYESVYQEHLAQSHAIAEAGLEDALHQLYLSPSWTAGFQNKPFAKGSYTVSIVGGASPVITSTGYSPPIPFLGTARTTVQATAQFTYGANVCPNLSGVSKAFLQGVVDSYSSSVNPNPATFNYGGNLCSNSNVQIQSSAADYVNGDVYYGTAPAPPASQVRGTLYPSTLTFVVPFYNGSSYVSTNSNLTGISPISYYSGGQLTVPSGATVTMQPGNYYLSGLTINSGGTVVANNTSGAVIIYLNGSMNLNGTFTNKTLIPSQLAIYTQGSDSINLQATSGSFYGVVEGPGATIFTSQVVYGRLAGASLNLTANLHYDLQTAGSGSTVTHVGWEMSTWSANR